MEIKKIKSVSPLALCLSEPVNHSSICPPTACVQFQDHDFILGCLADFPAVLLEEFLAEKHFVPLSVFSQAQLTEFLPAKSTLDWGRERGRNRKQKEISKLCWVFGCIKVKGTIFFFLYLWHNITTCNFLNKNKQREQIGSKCLFLKCASVFVI